MPKSWNVGLKDYLASNGTVSVLPPPVLRIANYRTEIVSQASNYDEPTTLNCRRWYLVIGYSRGNVYLGEFCDCLHGCMHRKWGWALFCCQY
jgi:hypothetical protein